MNTKQLFNARRAAAKVIANTITRFEMLCEICVYLSQQCERGDTFARALLNKAMKQ